MKIFVGGDYNASQQWSRIKKAAALHGHVIDVVEENTALDNYVAIAAAVAKKVRLGKNFFGILMCGTGQGTCIVANKFSHVYAARCLSNMDAQLARYVNNANVLCLAANTTVAINQQIVQVFFKTKYTGRKLYRLQAIKSLDVA